VIAPPGRRTIEFDGPATYRIVVQGALSRDWSERLGGLALTVTRHEGEAPCTTLIGPIQDQAALSGILDILYGLHMAILKVETIENEE
jgi:hypothetical protein